MKTNYKIGDVVTGTVTGIQQYGVFVKLSGEEQGLIHISEFRHGYVNNLSELVKVGDEIQVKIIDVDEFTHKISLSTRALQPLHVPAYPRRIRHRPKRHLPNIGFSTLARKLPDWIDEAIQMIVEDRFNILDKKKEKYHD